MLTATFCHIKGLSQRSEARLGQTACSRGSITANVHRRYSRRRRSVLVQAQLDESGQALAELNAAYFLERLPSAELPRVYPHLVGRIAYVDIETTGLGREAEITTVALYDGKTITTFIKDRNLEEFPNALSRYAAVVTYNGSRFDLPILRHEFGAAMNIPHLDLMRVLLCGGLHGRPQAVRAHHGTQTSSAGGHGRFRSRAALVCLYSWGRHCSPTADSLQLPGRAESGTLAGQDV